MASVPSQSISQVWTATSWVLFFYGLRILARSGIANGTNQPAVLRMNHRGGVLGRGITNRNRELCVILAKLMCKIAIQEDN